MLKITLLSLVLFVAVTGCASSATVDVVDSTPTLDSHADTAVLCVSVPDYNKACSDAFMREYEGKAVCCDQGEVRGTFCNNQTLGCRTGKTIAASCDPDTGIVVYHFGTCTVGY